MENNENETQASSQVQSVSGTRRKLLVAGSSVPILSLFVSRPVLGTPQQCSPSGFASMQPGNAGSQHGETGPCTGRSPGYWMNHWTWPGDNGYDYVPGMRATQNYDGSSSCTALGADVTVTEKDLLHKQNGNGVPTEFRGLCETTFLSVFGVTLASDAELTLMEVLRDNNVRNRLEFHAIAALLNAAAGQYGDMLDTTTVVNLYYAAANGSNFDTGSGVLTPDQIEDFLVSIANN